MHVGLSRRLTTCRLRGHYSSASVHVSSLVTPRRTQHGAGGDDEQKVTHSSGAPISSTTPLPSPPYGLPASPVFEAERLGGYSVKWLQHDLPHMRSALQPHLPTKDALWRSPPHEALTTIAQNMAYHDVLRIIMEHSYFFLFDTLLQAEDAPLPHILYADLMKCLTFSSLQTPPEWQFALTPRQVRTLLCIAAYHCTLDKHYFTSAQIWFRMMEQQQHTSSALLSGWVYVCTAAGRLDEALSMAQHMARYDVDFDKEVFALMQHPSLNITQLQSGLVPSVARGLVMQQRLCEQLSNQRYGNDAIATHAMFVYHALTLRHGGKWETLRLAVEKGIRLTPRTTQLAFEVFVREKGIRCGARTVKALVRHLAEGQLGVAALLYVLMRVRKNELLHALRGLPATAFTADEQLALAEAVSRCGRQDRGFRAAAPLIATLVRNDDPASLFHSLFATDSHGATSDGSTANDAQDTAAMMTVGAPGQADDVVPGQTAGVLQDILQQISVMDHLAHTKDEASCTTSQMTIDTYRAERDDALYAQEKVVNELAALGAQASLQAYTRNVLSEEATEARLAPHVATAWIDPDYRDSRQG